MYCVRMGVCVYCVKVGYTQYTHPQYLTLTQYTPTVSHPHTIHTPHGHHTILLAYDGYTLTTNPLFTSYQSMLLSNTGHTHTVSAIH